MAKAMLRLLGEPKQAWDFMAEQAITHLGRYRRNGQSVEDLKRAQFHLTRLIQLMEEAGCLSETIKTR